MCASTLLAIPIMFSTRPLEYWVKFTVVKPSFSSFPLKAGQVKQTIDKCGTMLVLNLETTLGIAGLVVDKLHHVVVADCQLLLVNFTTSIA